MRRAAALMRERTADTALPRVEMPFGGVKDSGCGCEGGSEAMGAYLNTKAVSILCA